MSARAPRRTFASPMVVTIVASASFGGCSISTKSPTPPPTITVDDGAPTGSGSRAAPASPVLRPAVTNPPMPGPTPPPVVSPMPGPTPPPVVPPPAPPGPSSRPVADRDYAWFVHKRVDGTCDVTIDVKCPTGKPGMPMPTCNPPPPMAITCPVALAGAQTVTITCVIPAPAVTCPPKTMCNPPPPTAVPCPK